MDPAHDLTPVEPAERAEPSVGPTLAGGLHVREPMFFIAEGEVKDEAGETIGCHATVGDDGFPAMTESENAGKLELAVAGMPLDDPRGVRSARVFRERARAIRLGHSRRARVHRP